MVSDTEVMKIMSQSRVPDIIEMRSELPELLNASVLLACVNRWREIRDYFKRPVRIYATCENLKVEKYMARVISNYENMYLTIVPMRRKEMLDID